MTMEQQAEKGMSTFLDVFRRADKNDDDALSWEEFKAFFADGVLSEGELSDLFHEIDTHNTNNIDTGELCTYFSKHLGPFKEIFSTVEDINTSVSRALNESAQQYPKKNLVEQFVTRFLLREIVNQFSAVQRPLDAASDVLDEQAQTESVTQKPQGEKSAALSMKAEGRTNPMTSESANGINAANITPGRYGRRTKRQISSQTSWTTEAGVGGGALNQQVDRLRGLLDRLENKVNFEGIPDEEIVAIETEKLVVVVHRKLVVNEESDKTFRNALRNYVEAANASDGCLHFNVRSYVGTSFFVLYEIWDGDDQWKSFCSSAPSKAFRHSTIDYLEVPEQLNTIRLPKSWWVQE